MDWLSLIGSLISTGAMAGGEMSAAADDAKKQQALKEMADKLKNLQVTGDLAPYDPTLLNSGDSQLAPEYKDAQMAALSKLKEISDSGGLTLEDQGNLNKLLNQSAVRERAGRGAIKEDMAARGTLGSGAELAMSLMNQQNAANRGSEAAQNTAAEAQKRAYAAIMSRGNMATNAGNSERQARDAINRYNAEAKDRAARYKNDVAGQLYNMQRQNALDQNQGLGIEANAAGDRAANTRGLWNTIGSGVGSAVASSSVKDSGQAANQPVNVYSSTPAKETSYTDRVNTGYYDDYDVPKEYDDVDPGNY